MAVVAYWRIICASSIKIVFITGKTSCALLRVQSIPKMELQAAVMAVRLNETVLNCHEISVTKARFWTD